MPQNEGEMAIVPIPHFQSSVNPPLEKPLRIILGHVHRSKDQVLHHVVDQHVRSINFAQRVTGSWQCVRRLI